MTMTTLQPADVLKLSLAQATLVSKHTFFSYTLMKTLTQGEMKWRQTETSHFILEMKHVNMNKAIV